LPQQCYSLGLRQIACIEFLVDMVALTGKGLETMALFYTIGHSTRSGTEFIDILDGVGLVADVRAFPRSRANPQFNSDALAGALREHGIDYVHLAELGGRRGRARSGGSSPNSFWQNQSFRNYADYAMTEAFQHGFARLRSLGRAKPCAIMCSEALWWRCHRRIIADYLIFAGETVVHILALGKMEMATPTPMARPTLEGRIVYSAGEPSS
jgi:uncharacterized protein (DUF488 family)